jgi:hypothetical protein
MPTFTLRQNKRYRATISLGVLQSFADNDLIAGKLIEAGFRDVSVSGSGGSRVAEARWPLADTTAPMPSEVTDVTEIA